MFLNLFVDGSVLPVSPMSAAHRLIIFVLRDPYHHFGRREIGLKIHREKGEARLKNLGRGEKGKVHWEKGEALFNGFYALFKQNFWRFAPNIND